MLHINPGWNCPRGHADHSRAPLSSGDTECACFKGIGRPICVCGDWFAGGQPVSFR